MWSDGQTGMSTSKDAETSNNIIIPPCCSHKTTSVGKYIDPMIMQMRIWMSHYPRLTTTTTTAMEMMVYLKLIKSRIIMISTIAMWCEYRSCCEWIMKNRIHECKCVLCNIYWDRYIVKKKYYTKCRKMPNQYWRSYHRSGSGCGIYEQWETNKSDHRSTREYCSVTSAGYTRSVSHSFDMRRFTRSKLVVQHSNGNVNLVVLYSQSLYTPSSEYLIN